ncbi:ubiquinol-cytochrome c reductase cytochrome c subunit [Kineococcus xinjiangensis]|uniref:Cytochrome bc1 complex cytochrome c subunit n=1 Tax=Kineococcus xinjiangensis TaxID=512762 RepID=A0A2S6IM40_9ACTN|nr:cytochrome c [Kineococcus xinjiangensis]PPK95297.1 ubiquinol-cytochrome c reductase cytochrome c subunit [Kineococcus xinjiangensis]
MTRTLSALSARRRHPLAVVLLIALALTLTGGLYAALVPQPASAQPEQSASATDIAEGEKLFIANCATCHGFNGEGGDPQPTGWGYGITGPSLVGVGAAAVDFQVGTGRMPLPYQGPQAVPAERIRFSQEQINQMAAYVASLGPGPAIPAEEFLDITALTEEEISRGSNIFRTNCAMCHNFAGAGGALTKGKEAPALFNVTERHIYEAMTTGPQSMPVFNDNTIAPEDKKAIIGFLKSIHSQPDPGGLPLGYLGPVSEGLFAWVAGIGLLIGCAVWLGMKSS